MNTWLVFGPCRWVYLKICYPHNKKSGICLILEGISWFDLKVFRILRHTHRHVIPAKESGSKVHCWLESFAPKDTYLAGPGYFWLEGGKTQEAKRTSKRGDEDRSQASVWRLVGEAKMSRHLKTNPDNVLESGLVLFETCQRAKTRVEMDISLNKICTRTLGRFFEASLSGT